MIMALIAAAASLLCGLAIYPFIVRLSADNARKTEELLDSHLAMMEAMGRADVFDALLSRRPYKAPMPFPEAIGIIRRDSGSHFDPQVAAVFLEIAESLHEQLQGCDEEACRRLLEDKVEHHFFSRTGTPGAVG